MAPPWETPRPRRKWLGLTQNSLVTAVISVVLSGIVSYLVAHQQSEDSARQAVTGQQVQEISQLESDVKSYYQLAVRSYELKGYCANKPSLGVCTGLTEPIYDSPIIKSELAIGTDLANVSDSKITKETDSLTNYTLATLSQVGTKQGYTAFVNMGNAYDSVITRCGQLIQGRN